MPWRVHSGQCLIHAATMVTAGVYLIVRSGPIFDLAPTAQTAVVVVGAVTLLFRGGHRLREGRHQEGTRGIDHASQIGYMVLAAGWGRRVTRWRSRIS